jgi:hypothetical protein
MLLALFSGPFFHLHDRDDHGNALVHAHFFESDHASSNQGDAVEAQHSHDHVRWVDVFTLSTPVTTFFHAVVEFSQILPLPAPIVSRAAISIQALRAHSPPEASDLVPRSPPAL